MPSPQDHTAVSLLAALLSGEAAAARDILEAWKYNPEQQLPLYEAAVLGGSPKAVAQLVAAAVPLGPAAEGAGGSSCIQIRLPGAITSLFRKLPEVSHLVPMLDQLKQLTTGRWGRHAAELAVAAGRTDLLAALQQAGANLAQDSLMAFTAGPVDGMKGEGLLAGLNAALATLEFLLLHGASLEHCERPALKLFQACRRSSAAARKFLSWLLHWPYTAELLRLVGWRGDRLQLQLAAAAGDMGQMERFAAELGHYASYDMDAVAVSAVRAEDTYALSQLLDYAGGLKATAAGGSNVRRGTRGNRQVRELLRRELRRQLREAAYAAVAKPIALELLLRAGREVDIDLLLSAVRQQGSASLRSLQLLLAADPPPQPCTHGIRVHTLMVTQAVYEDCPVWLAMSKRRAGQDLDGQALQKIEVLAAAGYRPSVFTQVTDRNGDREDYDPATDERSEFDIQGRHRYLWLAANPVPWSPQQHHRFPKQVQAAVRTLLLAANRGSRLAAGPAPTGAAARRQQRIPGLRQRKEALALVGCLPQEVLLKIAGMAAYPLSAWAR